MTWQRLVVEPAAAKLVLNRRRFCVASGHAQRRADRSHELGPSKAPDPSKATTVGDQVCAAAPGTTVISARLPGVEKPWHGRGHHRLKTSSSRSASNPRRWICRRRRQSPVEGLRRHGRAVCVLFPENTELRRRQRSEVEGRARCVVRRSRAVKLGQARSTSLGKTNSTPTSRSPSPTSRRPTTTQPPKRSIRRGQALTYRVSALKAACRSIRRTASNCRRVGGCSAYRKDVQASARQVGRTSVIASLVINRPRPISKSSTSNTSGRDPLARATSVRTLSTSLAVPSAAGAFLSMVAAYTPPDQIALPAIILERA